MCMIQAQRVQILARDNGAGLTRDIDMMQQVLDWTGARASARCLQHRGIYARALTRIAQLGKPPKYALNVMLERIRPEYIAQSYANVLVPNPEYVDRLTLKHLGKMKAIWCKTLHAVELFKSIGVPTSYIGFSSQDRWLPNVKRQDAFFHGPGRSNTKGTRALIELWRAHPQWPTLTIVWRRKHVQLPPLPSNIQLINAYIDDVTYRQIQNRFRFHLCPSQTEGFGHSIVEAMSCGAVVVTLDAAPMHELVTKERGILASARCSGQLGLALTWDLIPDSFSQAIETCLALFAQDKETLGQRAREWFLTRLPFFKKAMAKHLSTVITENE